MNNDTYKPSTNIYKYTSSMKYMLDEEKFSIEAINIKSIAIDYDFKNTNMPMIFITAAIDRNHLDMMIQNQDTGIIIFDLEKCISNSDMPDLYTKNISDKFIYFISEDINKNNDMDYSGDNSEREDLFKIVSFGMLCLDHVNNNKKSLNGVVTGNLSSLLYYITGHIPVLIEPPKENIFFNEQFLPPLNSVSKSIAYINNLNAIYDTSYRFFIDFDCSYLISSSGKSVKRQGEDITSILINIHSTTDMESKLQGMTINETEAIYQIDVDAIDCEISDNHISNNLYSKVIATDASGNVLEKSLSSEGKTSVVKKSKMIRLPNANSRLLDNMISSVDNSSIQLLVQKTDIDSSVFTINKEYLVKADEVYGSEKYNGRYILSHKRELYIRNDEEFVMNTMLLFEKVLE